MHIYIHIHVLSFLVYTTWCKKKWSSNRPRGIIVFPIGLAVFAGPCSDTPRHPFWTWPKDDCF